MTHTNGARTVRGISRSHGLLVVLAIGGLLSGCSTGSADGSGSSPAGSTAELVLEPTGGFEAQGPTGGPFAPRSKSYRLRNNGSRPIDFSVTSTAAWVQLSVERGTLAVGATATVIVAIDQVEAAKLAPGDHSARVDFTNASGGTGSASVTVRLTATAQPAVPDLAVDPTGDLAVQGLVGGPFTPSGRAYTLTNLGTQSLAYAVSTTRSWLRISDRGGVLTAGSQTNVRILIDQVVAGTLGPGRYTGDVRFSNTSGGAGDATVTVTLDIINPPVAADMGVSPTTGFTAQGLLGGPFTPAGQDHALTNLGTEALEYEVTADQAWLRISTTGGRLDGGASVPVRVSIEQAVAERLSPGTYNGVVRFANVSGGAGDVSVTVTLEVRAPAAVAEMSLTPPSGFTSQGVVGGPFVPGGASYQLSNLGVDPMDFQAVSSHTWLQVVPSTGQVAGGGSIPIAVNIDQTLAAALPPGSASATVDFFNLTTGVGDVSIGTVLEIVGQASMSVTPSSPLTATGDKGGPFSSLTKDYTITNNGSADLDWSVTPAFKQVTATPESGTLGAGQSVVVTVAIDEQVARTLFFGTYSVRVQFVNETNGIGTTDRMATLNVVAPPTGTVASSISQWGVTWTFDRDYQVGQFVTGDWWVVGPVTIVSIDPPSVSGGRVMNGSMINPSPRLRNDQGYDSTMNVAGNAYKAHLNVALDVSPSNPLVVQPHSSLVSSISLPAANIRPQLESASVLTVLDAEPPQGSFRPSYSGADKTVRYNVSQLDRSLLRKLAPVGSTPDMDDVAADFERTWVDTTPGWSGSFSRPRDNMPNYGREIADEVGQAALMLHLDFPDAEKELLLTRFVQLGIDLYGVLQDGGGNNWYAAGGWASGRKWPVLFAGLMLGDSGMSSIGLDPSLAFGEDGQTFYVAQTSPGVFNFGYGGYGLQEVGTPDWGMFHGWDPSKDDVAWFGNPYRLCCTANAWWGEILACRIMGAQSLWNHPALFDYQDRFLTANVQQGRHRLASALDVLRVGHVEPVPLAVLGEPLTSSAVRLGRGVPREA